MLRAARAAGDLRPIIVIAERGDEYVAVRAMQAGADEYIPRAHLTPAALERAI